MKLYDRQGTPNAARIRIVLAEKRLDDAVELIPVDLRAAEQKAPAFLAMNPIGKTPVLVLDDGLAISECTAITEYLDTLDGAPILTGVTPRERALVHMMQRRVEILLLDPIDDYFHYGTRGLGPALRPWRQPDWANAKEWGERRGAQAVVGAAYFEEFLGPHPYLAGDFFSMADITLFAALAFGTAIGLSIAPEGGVLAEWRARIAELPAVKNRGGQNFPPEDPARMRGQ
jgi:glutathione S-transferase